jgi:hypothetical protein
MDSMSIADFDIMWRLQVHTKLFMHCDFLLVAEEIEILSPVMMFTGRQLLMPQSIHKCQDSCPLAISARILQYRPWDPGVHLSFCAIIVPQLRKGTQVMLFSFLGGTLQNLELKSC